MLSTVLQILLIFVILLLPACKPASLKEAENIMTSDPLSALSMLEEIKPGYDNMSDKEKALFGVLYFQALNKNILDLHPVEMIDFSLDYFRRKKDKYYLSYALFYKARYLRNNKQYSNSVVLLLQSLDLAERTKDENLIAKIYFDLGFIAIRQEEFEKSKDYYERSVYLFFKLNETDNQVNSLCGLGMVYNKLKDFSKAYDYYHEALSLCADSLTRGKILYEIGNNYYEQMELDSALHYVSQTLNYPFVGNNQSLRHLVLAQLYFDLRENDRAVEHANLALTFPTDFYIQRECYVVLTNVSFIKNDKEKTALYLDSYMAFVDSVIKLESQPRISVLEEVHSANRELNKLQKNRYIFVSLILLLILVSGIFFYSIYRNKIVKTDTK